MVAYLRFRDHHVSPHRHRTELLLLHPLDLIGGDQAPALQFFPGMDLPGHRKVQLFSRCIADLGRAFSIGGYEHARARDSEPARARAPPRTAPRRAIRRGSRRGAIVVSV